MMRLITVGMCNFFVWSQLICIILNWIVQNNHREPRISLMFAWISSSFSSLLLQLLKLFEKVSAAKIVCLLWRDFLFSLSFFLFFCFGFFSSAILVISKGFSLVKGPCFDTFDTLTSADGTCLSADGRMFWVAFLSTQTRSMKSLSICLKWRLNIVLKYKINHCTKNEVFHLGFLQ